MGMRVLFCCLLSCVILPLLASPGEVYHKLQTSSQHRRQILPGNSEEITPEFGSAETNVTVQSGGTAFLHCPVMNPGERPVSYPLISWVRIKDWHILSNGLETFSTDKRFNVLYTEGSFDWVLQIKWVSQDDVGVYECQVSTSTGIISRQVTLNVVTPEAFIQGGAEYHVDQGSMISLTCVIELSPIPPQYVFWFHNDRMVNYDQERGVEVDTDTESGDRTVSRLILKQARKRDEGNYTCKPSNTPPATVRVFVSEDDKMDALKAQSSSQESSVLSSSGSISYSVKHCYYIVTCLLISSAIR